MLIEFEWKHQAQLINSFVREREAIIIDGVDDAGAIVHQQMRAKLIQLARQNPKQTPQEDEELMKVLIAIDVLEALYPKARDHKWKPLV